MTTDFPGLGALRLCLQVRARRIPGAVHQKPVRTAVGCSSARQRRCKQAPMLASGTTAAGLLLRSCKSCHFYGASAFTVHACRPRRWLGMTSRASSRRPVPHPFFWRR